jgi:hypothetical protein
VIDCGGNLYVEDVKTKKLIPDDSLEPLLVPETLHISTHSHIDELDVSAVPEAKLEVIWHTKSLQFALIKPKKIKIDFLYLASSSPVSPMDLFRLLHIYRIVRLSADDAKKAETVLDYAKCVFNKTTGGADGVRSLGIDGSLSLSRFVCWCANALKIDHVPSPLKEIELLHLRWVDGNAFTLYKLLQWPNMKRVRISTLTNPPHSLLDSFMLAAILAPIGMTEEVIFCTHENKINNMELVQAALCCPNDETHRRELLNNKKIPPPSTPKLTLEKQGDLLWWLMMDGQRCRTIGLAEALA